MRDESLIAFYESVRRKFEQTCSLAGVIASSASQQGNTPTPFAKKWTDDE